MNTRSAGRDDVDQAVAVRIIDDLAAALREAAALNAEALERLERVLDLAKSGMPPRDVADAVPGPLIFQTLTRSLTRQAEAGARFRRLAVRTLYAEGMSTEEIAKLFGVTRQRVSALINTPLPE